WRSCLFYAFSWAAVPCGIRNEPNKQFNCHEPRGAEVCLVSVGLKYPKRPRAKPNDEAFLSITSFNFTRLLAAAHLHFLSSKIGRLFWVHVLQTAQLQDCRHSRRGVEPRL